MADIARTIQTGTAQFNQGLDTMSDPARVRSNATYMHEQNALQKQQLKVAMEQRADLITNSVLSAVNAKNMVVSQRKKDVDDLLSKLPSWDETPDNKRAEVQAIHDRTNEAMKLYEAAIVDRNNLIEGISKMDGVMIAMDKSTYYNKDIGAQVFNEEILSSMTESQRSDTIGRLVALQQAKQEQEYATGQLEHQRQIELETVKGMMRGSSASQQGRQPLKEGLAFDVYNASLQRMGADIGELTNAERAEWWNDDIAPYVKNSPQFRDIPNEERAALQEVFRMWQPGEYGKQSSQVGKFAETFNRFYKQTAGMTPMATRIMDSIYSIVNKDTADPRRLGMFIETIKDYVRPYETLQPRQNSAASGGDQ